jgi:hypothetical protein
MCTGVQPVARDQPLDVWRVVAADRTVAARFSGSRHVDLYVLPSTGEPCALDARAKVHADTLHHHSIGRYEDQPVPFSPSLQRPNPGVEFGGAQLGLEALYALGPTVIFHQCHGRFVDVELRSGGKRESIPRMGSYPQER